MSTVIAKNRRWVGHRESVSIVNYVGVEEVLWSFTKSKSDNTTKKKKRKEKKFSNHGSQAKSLVTTGNKDYDLYCKIVIIWKVMSNYNYWINVKQNKMKILKQRMST